MPLAVISKTRQFALPPSFPKDVAKRLYKAWPLAQNTLIGLEPQTPHILATGSDHYVQIHDPDLVTSVIRLIFVRGRALVRRGRTTTNEHLRRARSGLAPPARQGGAG